MGRSRRESAHLLFSRRALNRRCSICSHGCANELFEGRLVDLLAFANVDRTTRISFQARIEKLLRIIEVGSTREGQLHHLLMRLPCADNAVMRKDGHSSRI